MESLVYIKRQFLNGDLKKSTDKIKRCGENIRKNYIKVASELANVDKMESYLDDGFESTIDYAGQIFGISKTTAYVLINIGRDWVNENGERTVLTEDGADYSVSQIGVLQTVGVYVARELHNKGLISPDMSVRSIRAVIKGVKTDTDTETKTETETETDEDEDTNNTERVESLGEITFYADGDTAIKGNFPEWFLIELDSLYKKVLDEINS